MALEKINPSKTLIWKELQCHFAGMQERVMQEMFKDDLSRAAAFRIEWNDFLVDYSKNRITKETMKLLFSLADEVHLKEAIKSYFGGDKINETENRPVLHTALRSTQDAVLNVDGENIISAIFEVKNKIENKTHKKTVYQRQTVF